MRQQYAIYFDETVYSNLIKIFKTYSFLVLFTILTHCFNCILNLDTWIMYRGDRKGVSKVVRDAYKSAKEKDIDYFKIALINISGAQVNLFRIK